MKWWIVDSLACPEQFFCSHLDSYGHYLREFGDSVAQMYWTSEGLVSSRQLKDFDPSSEQTDVLFMLDCYGSYAPSLVNVRRIAQVAAICNPMPWNVRRDDSGPVYDLILSSIPWMVEEARKHGCRAEYMPLAFDLRARACMMGVKRERGCIFIGTTGPNHAKRTQLLHELRDVVEVMPPVYGREYFRTLASAKAVLNIHAEWSRGAANNMRLYEAAGMGCGVVSDGRFDDGYWEWWGRVERNHNAASLIDAIDHAAKFGTGLGHGLAKSDEWVIANETYESRIPRLVELARSL